MNENELYLLNEYKFDNPFITGKDSISDNCFKDCHNNYFHKFIFESVYDNKLTNITGIKIFDLTINDKSMDSYDLNKKLKVVRHNIFKFNK